MMVTKTLCDMCGKEISSKTTSDFFDDFTIKVRGKNARPSFQTETYCTKCEDDIAILVSELKRKKNKEKKNK